MPTMDALNLVAELSLREITGRGRCRAWEFSPSPSLIGMIVCPPIARPAWPGYFRAVWSGRSMFRPDWPE